MNTRRKRSGPRKRNQRVTPIKRPKNAVRWRRDIDWKNTSDHLLAYRYNCHINTVRNYRERMRLPKGPRKPGTGMPRRIDRSKCDIRKSAIENAKAMGCHVNWARAIMVEKGYKVRRMKRRKTRPAQPADNGVKVDDLWV